LNELIQLMQPFGTSSPPYLPLVRKTADDCPITAKTPSQPTPPSPAPFLHTRFLTLTNMIHQSLKSLSPYVHPNLLPTFPPYHTPITATNTGAPQEADRPTKRKRDVKYGIPMSAAEKEMEVIRKRRDALIAKAAMASTSGVTPNQKEVKESDIVEMDDDEEIEEEIEEDLDMGIGVETGRMDAVQVEGLMRGMGTVQGRCHGCGVGTTLEWRKGPDGPSSLCDSCGVSRLVVQ
jgi:hypothetical protein